MARRFAAWVLGFVGALMIVSDRPAALYAELPLRMSAHAVNLGTTGTTGSLGTIEIVINRWSTDAERERVVLAARGKDLAQLRSDLEDFPAIGYLRVHDEVPYALRYARRTPPEDGRDHITILTDRPVSFREATEHPSRIDYSLTFIEVRLSPDGTGDGRLALAAKLKVATGSQRLTFDDYASEPVRLQALRAHWSR